MPMGLMVQALKDVDGDMQFDSPDDFTRAIAGQTERGVGRIGGQSVSGESLSANAVRQMQAAGTVCWWANVAAK